MTALYFYGAAFDALLVLGVGVYAAGLLLLGKKDQLDVITGRVIPAVATLVGTTVAAGIILAVARWAFPF